MIRYEDVKQIHIEVSSFCNAACPNCPRNIYGGFKSPTLVERSMTFNDFVKLVDAATVKNLTQFRFCGNFGDPISCKDLPKIISWIYETNPEIKIEINTNGGVRSGNWWAELGSIMKDRAGSFVIFSVDGLEDTNHIYRRNVDWKKLERNFVSFINAGGAAIWEMLVFAHNEHQIKIAEDRSKEYGFFEFRKKKPFGFNDTFRKEPYMFVIDGNGNFDYSIWPKDSTPKKLDDEIVLKKLDEIKYAFSSNSLTEEWSDRDDYLSYMDERYTDGIDCMSIRDQEIYIDSQGYVYPCCFLGQSGQVSRSNESRIFRKWIEDNIGWDNISLHNKSIREIIESEYFSKISHTWDMNHVNGKITMCSLMCSSDCKKNAVRNLYER